MDWLKVAPQNKSEAIQMVHPKVPSSSFTYRLYALLVQVTITRHPLIFIDNAFSLFPFPFIHSYSSPNVAWLPFNLRDPPPHAYGTKFSQLHSRDGFK